MQHITVPSLSGLKIVSGVMDAGLVTWSHRMHTNVCVCVCACVRVCARACVGVWVCGCVRV